MRTSLTVLITLVFVLNQLSAFSQEVCKVLMPDISGKYTGDCKNGLADGKGVAEGKDKYEGKFKKGLPNGQGIYKWSTGEVYNGAWSEGKKQGEGKLTFKSNGKDTTTVGIWKNDAFFKKKTESPYNVRRVTSIKRYSVEKEGDGNKVVLAIMKNGNNNSSIMGLTFFCTSGMMFNIGPKMGYDNVTFPCTVRIIYTTTNAFNTGSFECEFELEIKTPGSWEIKLDN